jgi:hypothetical protein
MSKPEGGPGAVGAARGGSSSHCQEDRHIRTDIVGAQSLKRRARR